MTANLGQGLSLAGWTTSLWLLAVTIAAYLWSRTASLASSTQPTQGVRLTEVYSHKTEKGPDDTEIETDIDIIAIHGLDTKSPDTWTWRRPKSLWARQRKNTDEEGINWLQDQRMLPASVGQARIFTCDWPSDLFQPSDLVQKRIEEYARLLFNGIHQRRINDPERERPILFIASCLGGIILMKALVDADNKKSDYYPLRRATRGIVFLATPFRGTSFEDVANFAEPGLNSWAWIQGQTVTKLLQNAKGPTSYLQSLVGKFTQLCQNKDYPCQVFNFYELGKTSLPSKVFPWLPAWLHQAKPLVDEVSATLDIVPEPLSLDRTHVLMNKFENPECPDYKKVVGKIQDMLKKIREGTLLVQADAWIRDKHYTADRLKIERLSGESLSMEQCYINLAIVEQLNQNVNHTTQQSFPLSLRARLRVQTPAKNIQIELPALFDQRQGRNGNILQPRRILIRGRAGVGKTTLCKKIVHEFTHGTWSEWTKLFDRILWIPLRRLKLKERRRASEYTFFHLVNHEYFSLLYDRRDLARAMSDCLEETKSSRTLFLLDGLDEVSQDLSDECAMSSFLKALLNQPNVIITSRPYSKPPAGLDLELETIGFNPDQVNEYLANTLTDIQNMDQIKLFLRQHQLIQDLVRIPIQLDALCFIWEQGLSSGANLDTMTSVYQAIEKRLWKKDILRLEKKHDGTQVTKDLIQSASRLKLENLVQAEILLLEGLAFTGLFNNIIEFKLELCNTIFDHFAPSLLPDKTLPCLSFLRTSHPSETSIQSCHFLHLTYQEYFAARYFARQWRHDRYAEHLDHIAFEDGKVTCIKTTPIIFLQKYKYTAYYDIFWRFVAGLLDTEGDAEQFFKAVEQEPLDMLGRTHQRFIMHCLSEVSPEMLHRKSLQQKLSQWLLFECDFCKSGDLASEVEFPEPSLFNTLFMGSKDIKITILQSLQRRTIPSSIINLIVSWLQDEDEDWHIRRVAVEALRDQSPLPEEILTVLVARLQDWDVGRDAAEALHYHSTLPEAILRALVARLEDPHENVREAAVIALSGQSTKDILTALVARLQDKDWGVPGDAAKALRNQSTLPEAILIALVARLQDESWYVRKAAMKALHNQSSLPEAILTVMVARLQDESESLDVRYAAEGALRYQSTLPEAILTVLVARLEDKDGDVRQGAVEALSGQSTEAILAALVARLEDPHENVREAAVVALRSQSTEEILTVLVARLQDEDWGVRRAAAEALRYQPTLPEAILTALVARLEDPHENVRQGAVEALSDQSTEAILTAFAARLEDPHENVRWAATEALSNQSTLPEAILIALVARLEDPKLIRRAAAKALRKQSTLPEAILTALAGRLEDEDEYIRELAVEALGGQSPLPEAILTALVARLDDESQGVQRAAARTILRIHLELYPNIINGRFIGLLYGVLLRKTFGEQCSWYIEGEQLYINGSSGIIGLGIGNVQDVIDVIERARPPGMPSLATALY